MNTGCDSRPPYRKALAEGLRVMVWLIIKIPEIDN